MGSSFVIKVFVAVFAYILFEQGRALATGKLPEVPRPIAHLFSLSADFLRSLDENTNTPPGSSGALAATHADLEPALAAELASVRQSPLDLAKVQIGQRMKMMAPWAAPQASERSATASAPAAEAPKPQAAPAAQQAPLVPADPEIMKAVLRSHIKRAQAIRAAHNPRATPLP
jgi:hypothetical protein